MLKGIISKIRQRLTRSSHKDTPSAKTDAGAAQAPASCICSEVPVYCLGYLPLKLRRKIQLRDTWRSLGLSNKLLNQAMKQIDGRENN